jgi:LPXTG-site transpeptidase (sortase) family protein
LEPGLAYKSSRLARRHSLSHLAGNTVLTAHAFKADGKPGPFALLKNLKYGDKVIIHFGSLKYTYEIRTNFLVKPTETKWITKHETLDWITMITCQ